MTRLSWLYFFLFGFLSTVASHERWPRPPAAHLHIRATLGAWPAPLMACFHEPLISLHQLACALARIGRAQELIHECTPIPAIYDTDLHGATMIILPHLQNVNTHNTNFVTTKKAEKENKYPLGCHATTKNTLKTRDDDLPWYPHPPAPSPPPITAQRTPKSPP